MTHADPSLPTISFNRLDNAFFKWYLRLPIQITLRRRRRCNQFHLFVGPIVQRAQHILAATLHDFKDAPHGRLDLQAHAGADVVSLPADAGRCQGRQQGINDVGHIHKIAPLLTRASFQNARGAARPAWPPGSSRVFAAGPYT